MVEETAVENGRIFKFEGLVTNTLTLDQVILHTVMHHLSTSTYMPNFTEIEETFVAGWTNIRTDRHLRPALLGQLCQVIFLKTSSPRVKLSTYTCSSHSGDP